jgi:hypothetical protein
LIGLSVNDNGVHISAQQEVIKFAAETKEGLNFHKQMTEAMVYPGQSKKEWGFQTVGGIAILGGVQRRAG